MDWRAHSLAASGGCWGAAAGAVAKLAASRPTAAKQALLYAVHVMVRLHPIPKPLRLAYKTRCWGSARRSLCGLAAADMVARSLNPKTLFPNITIIS